MEDRSTVSLSVFQLINVNIHMNIFFSATTTKQVIKVRLERKDSSLDLNDPAVMEQMLKEVNHVGPF